MAFKKKQKKTKATATVVHFSSKERPLKVNQILQNYSHSCSAMVINKPPGLKSEIKSALNSAVSEISKISALISAVSEWVKKTSADQRFQSCSALVFSESALFSAGSKRSDKPTKMLRVSSKRYWDHEKHVLLECTSYEKNHSGEILVKNSNWHTHLFLVLLGRTCPVE